MWKERNRDNPNYQRMDYVHQQHHLRYRAYVKRHGLICQECGGAGGEVERINELGGPCWPCGTCEATGQVTRWGRGRWLRWKRDEAKARARKKAA